MSASSKPTFKPCNAKPIARLTDTVDLPTPPLPEATAIICFTFESAFSCDAATMSISISPKVAFNICVAVSMSI